MGEGFMTSKRLGSLVLFALVCAMPAAAQAQYPVKPVRLIVPFPPGGSSDLLGRIIGQKLGDALGQQVVVENRPGAAGNIGAEAVAKSPPDGYTVLLGNVDQAISMSFLDKLNYHLVRDLTSISGLAFTPLAVTVHASLPAKSIKELLGLAKARPNELGISSPGAGSAGHLAAELLCQMGGVRMTQVAYKGGAPATIALLTGEVAAGFPSVATALPYIKSAKLRILAVTSSQRAASVPDVPTVSEAGLPGYEIVLWGGLFAPNGTPRDIVSLLSRESLNVLKLRDVRERFDAAGMTAFGATQEEFGTFVRNEVDKWAKVVKASGARPN
jgi:tripartite-type tricarboxylate transporter receptor subunit TctC